MMLEEGFGGGDPKIKIGQLADALFAVVQICGRHSDARRGADGRARHSLFYGNAYMGETPSRIEAERGSFDPTYLVYSVGKLAILKLREDYKRYRGREFSLCEF
jgi:hypothetical protein